MRSRWTEDDAQAAVERCSRDQIDRDFALRIYSTRLLGEVGELVQHGGGNTSLKTATTDIFGENVAALRVKASGAEMATIEASGFAAVRLDRMQKLRTRAALSEREMARLLRASLLDPEAPNPSVEVLLHAFLPHKFVDHTHASAVLTLTDQPNAEAICNEVYGVRIGFVPYAMPGLPLARLASEVYHKAPRVEGLLLEKHGLFTFGESARESYERMIALVSLAEEHIARRRKAVFVSVSLPKSIAPVAAVAPVVRGACSRKSGDTWQRSILAFRTGPGILDFVNGVELSRYGRAGVVTPDHALRIKNWPLILPAPEDGELTGFQTAARTAVGTFVAAYEAYFARQNARVGNIKKMLDPMPRVALVPGLGLFGIGRSHRAAAIAADIAASAIAVISDAEAIGRFESISEADVFDMEYWLLEQAKLAAPAEQPLLGQIAVITGGAGSIGRATAKAFASAGAEIALLDLNEKRASELAASIGGGALALQCDVTDAASVEGAFDTIAEAFGGVDILVSNAGAAWQGKIGDVDESVLQESFDLNFYAHQRAAQAAVRIMRLQGTGGCLLFNVSKQAVNPGTNFGPYGLPKAATLFLVRQYALEYGADGIRANAVNADRIRSGLVTDDFIAERARARGMNTTEYLTDNLLRCEVNADDVALAFLHQALELKTTANVTTVDGGNIAAALR
jgi:rhamnose utilization protein RhaD (predicted bifunctional aldolase and dehydrogenase)/NAD(P)-dependent dehydrogenase (short-subunit alcohol dehydrogenase family)